MKSNVWAAPKAPAIAPSVAALLSVCFKLLAPPLLLLFSAYRLQSIKHHEVDANTRIRRLPMFSST